MHTRVRTVVWACLRPGGDCCGGGQKTALEAPCGVLRHTRTRGTHTPGTPGCNTRPSGTWSRTCGRRPCGSWRSASSFQQPLPHHGGPKRVCRAGGEALVTSPCGGGKNGHGCHASLASTHPHKPKHGLPSPPHTHLRLQRARAWLAHPPPQSCRSDCHGTRTQPQGAEKQVTRARPR
jgi:hypothetical protein